MIPIEFLESSERELAAIDPLEVFDDSDTLDELPMRDTLETVTLSLLPLTCGAITLPLLDATTDDVRVRGVVITDVRLPGIVIIDVRLAGNVTIDRLRGVVIIDVRLRGVVIIDVLLRDVVPVTLCVLGAVTNGFLSRTVTYFLVALLDSEFTDETLVLTGTFLEERKVLLDGLTTLIEDETLLVLLELKDDSDEVLRFALLVLLETPDVFLTTRELIEGVLLLSLREEKTEVDAKLE